MCILCLNFMLNCSELFHHRATQKCRSPCVDHYARTVQIPTLPLKSCALLGEPFFDISVFTLHIIRELELQNLPRWLCQGGCWMGRTLCSFSSYLSLKRFLHIYLPYLVRLPKVFLRKKSFCNFKKVLAWMFLNFH